MRPTGRRPGYTLARHRRRSTARRSTALAALALSSLAACADPISSDSTAIPGALKYSKSGSSLAEVASAKTNKVEPAGVDRGRYNITFRYLGSTDPNR